MQATDDQNDNYVKSETARTRRRSKGKGQYGADEIDGENILLFIPNVITISRVLLILSMGLFDDKDYYLVVAALYLTNMMLDHADGFAARRLKQCSVFGQVLDTVLDHVAYGYMLIAAYAACQSYIYRLYIWIQIFLKVFVHYYFMISSGMMSTDSHKLTGERHYFVMTLFYNPIVCDITITGMTTFDAAQYVIWFTEGPKVFSVGIVYWVYLLTLPFHLLHMSVSLCKIPVATRWLLHLSRQKRDRERQEEAEAEKAK